MTWTYDLPRFATGGSADVTEPTESKKDLGWVAEKPPHEIMNWLHENTYVALNELDKLFNPRSLEELDAALSAGEVGRLAPSAVQGFGFPDPVGIGDTFPASFPSGVAFKDAACNSTDIFVAASSTTVEAYSKDFSIDDPHTTYTLSGGLLTGVVTRIAASPNYVAVAWVDGGVSFFVDIFDVDGTLLHTYTAGAGGGTTSIKDLAINEFTDRVLIGDGDQFVAYDITAGAVDTSVAVDSQILGVVTTREFGVVICDPSDGGGDITPGEQIFCFDIGNSVIEWESRLVGNVTTGAQAVCVNGARVFVACENAGGLASIYVYSLMTGDPWNYGGHDITGILGGPFPVDDGTTSTDPKLMACDDRFIYLIGSNGLIIVDQHDLMQVQRIDNVSNTVYCDFDRVFAGGALARQTPQAGLAMVKTDPSSDRYVWPSFSLVPASSRSMSI